MVLLNQQPRPDAYPTDLGLEGLQEEADSSMEGSQQDSLLGRVTATAESGRAFCDEHLHAVLSGMESCTTHCMTACW